MSEMDFGLFDDLFDDIEQENSQSAKKNASDIKSLIEFIGGFDKWSILNEDCRREVVKYLDYKSRCQLGICSKSDYATVEATPIFVHHLGIVDNTRSHYPFSEEEFENVVVNVNVDSNFNSGRRFELIFSEHENQHTLIQWEHYSPKKRPEIRKLVLESKNYYEEAIRFFEKWMKKCKYEVESICIEMRNYRFDTSRIKRLPMCRNVRIGSDDLDSFSWWLEKVPDQLDDLQLANSERRSVFTLPSEFLNAPQITQTTKFCFWCRAAFTDDQFLNLQAKSMNFDSVGITDEGINRFLKKWVNGRGNGFREAHLWGQGGRNGDTLIRGLEVRPWDDAFEEEARGFVSDFEHCCGRDTCYQIASLIDPFESITLSIHDDRVSIYHTGRKFEHCGRVYTSYSIP